MVRGTVGSVIEILAVAEPTAEPPDGLLMLGLLVGVPLLVVLLVAAIVLGPQWSRAGRWRPGQPWREDPLWLGPGDPEKVAETLAIEPVRPEFVPGGARGRW